MASDKEALLAAFERFLAANPQVEAGPAVGPAQVLVELTALRIETQKLGRTLNDLLEREQADRAARLQSIERERLRPVLLDLIELRDRLEAGIEALARLRPTWLTRLMCRRKGLRFQAVLAGFKLILLRLDQQLAALGVEAIEAQDRPFDPATMRAAEVVCLRRLPEAQVVGVLRRGWRWRGEVLKVAEVRVNKRG